MIEWYLLIMQHWAGRAAGGVMVFGTTMAGAAASVSVNEALDDPSDFRAWLWGGGALACLAMAGRAAKFIGDRVDRFTGALATERDDRVRAETELRLEKQKVAELERQLAELGDKRHRT